MNEPEVFVGENKIFAGNFAPVGWAFCDGRTLLIKDHEALYELIGETFGKVDSVNFRLPDLRWRVPIQCGRSDGLTGGAFAEIGGTESADLTVENLPLHTHSRAAACRFTPAAERLWQ